MDFDAIKNTINSNQKYIAFIVGNGINRFNTYINQTSWEDLLLALWEKCVDSSTTCVPKGISLTEYYDILEVNRIKNNKQINLQKEFCYLMKNWGFQQHHTNFIEYVKRIDAPILTTNFDDIFKKAGSLEFYKIRKNGFTDFYPWECYYGERELEYPTDGFGVWHINGMKKYHRSIRLGLTHYMGSVERARHLIHKGDEKRLFRGKDVKNWSGCKTWLHIIFNKELVILGLGLEQNEVFLRWLLIERAKYFNVFPNRTLDAWYITTKGKTNQGKKLFLESLGIKIIELDNYDEIYLELWN